jgi:DNA-directed RNA polymerase
MHVKSWWRFKYSRRSSANTMGRFGGGWQWKFGIQASSGSVLISLLISELRIDIRSKKEIAAANARRAARRIMYNDWYGDKTK